MNFPIKSERDKVSILVVDDVPDKLVSMEVILQDLDEEVVTASSGREALRQLLERDFAVILLDVNMPDMDGFETAAMIRQRKRSEHTPIIFITAYSDDTHAVHGYSLGAVDYILAPVIPEVLRTKIAVFVDLFRKTQQVRQQAEERIALAKEQAARAAAEDATRRSMFLAEASDTLAKSLDYENTIRVLLQLVLTTLADSAALAMSRSYDVHAQVEIAAANGSETDYTTVPWESLPPELATVVESVLESRKTHCGRIGSGKRARKSPSHQTSLDRLVEAHSLAFIPLMARGRTLGIFCLARQGEREGFTKIELAVAEDLTARAAIALDNTRLYREIQEGDRRKDEFLAMLSHELRNPLAAITNALECLKESRDDEEIFNSAEQVLDRQVTQMARLVDDLLDVSRITRGKVELRKEIIQLQSAVERAVSASRPMIAARRHDLTVSMPPEDLRLHADPVRLEQVLANLLNNAAKYTEPGGKIFLNVLCDDAQVDIRVRDTGMGIAPHLLPNVFDLFTQGDRSLDRSQGGLGIGLTLVRSLVALHGGQVEAFSEGPRQGSEFVVRLPILTEPAEAAASPDGAAAELAPTSASRRILLVDDNPDLTATMATLLKKLGHDVRIAADGPSAIDLATDFQPELVLVDIGLPGMNGYEVAHFLRQRLQMEQTFLVAMTGYGQSEDRQRSKEAGFDDHLVKPVPLRTVQELLARLQPNLETRALCSRPS